MSLHSTGVSKESLTRRSFVRRGALATGAITTGAFHINTRLAAGALFAPPTSPPTTPWVQPLAFPRWAVPTQALSGPAPIPSAHQRYEEFLPQDVYEIPVRMVAARPHPQLGLTNWMSYDGQVPGPTFMTRLGRPILVRYRNELPEEIQGFGHPEIVTHVHNGNHASESDGGPWDMFGPGSFKDHHYPQYAAAGDPDEAKGTLWYHDHAMDFTAQNTYRGLAGFYLMFDELDSGDENDPNPNALRLPSGVPNGEHVADCHDIPLAIMDRGFDRNGILAMDVMDMDGIVSDKYLVNGRVQPYFEVKRRKYRFRVLDAGPARYYDFWLSNGMEFQIIGTDGNLLQHPVPANHFAMGPGERYDIVIDFASLPESTTVLYLVNRVEMPGGRGPKNNLLPMNESPRVLKFVIRPGAVADPSRVPGFLREEEPIDPADVARATRRTWDFDRKNGMWTVNGKLFDPNRVDAVIPHLQPEIWTIKAHGGWAHPIHFHLEEGRILSFNGGEEEDPVLLGRKDVFSLRGGEEMEIFVRFHDWVGKYPIHCHNGTHEDHAMMVRFDVVRSLEEGVSASPGA
ncbi:MAG: multicopper oxidase family protein [Phycisphaerales bacterium]